MMKRVDGFKAGRVMGEKKHKPGSYSQFLHLLHAHRHAARFLGGYIPATGQGKHTMQALEIRRRGIKKGRDISKIERRVRALIV